MEASELELTEENFLKEDIKTELTHAVRVSNLAYYLGKQLEIREEDCKSLAVIGILHDIGKIRLSPHLYGEEKATLKVEKMKYVRMHASLGAEILKEEHYPESVVEGVLYHHENYDGSGYPQNLSGKEIPFSARIIRVCDVYAALTSDRTYRKAFEPEVAVELMIEEAKNFDLKIFLAFQRLVHEDILNEIMKKNIFK